MSSETLNDGVHRYPPTGIKVIIVGAGNGGMQAALECWRKGCDVVVLERAKGISPIGDFFTITPPGLVTLKEYPSMHADYHRTVYNCCVSAYSPSGKEIKTQMPEWKRPGVVHAAPDVDISFLKRRPDFANMQLDQLKRFGVPVHFDKKVTALSEDENGVTVETESGETYAGDVCVAADGIGSTFSQHFAEKQSVQDSGYAIARVAFPRDKIKAGSPADYSYCQFPLLTLNFLQSLVKDLDVQPEFRVYLANDVHLILYLTKDYVGIALTHESKNGAAESWHNLKEPDLLINEVLKSSENWDPAVIDFLRQTPEKVVDWKLMWRDGSETWTSNGGRVVALGDSAHAFLPTSGNGSVQALEDGISLGECLRMGGKANVRWATKIHNKLRFERTSVLQQTGFVNRDELHHADLDAIDQGCHIDVGFFKIGKWVWEHNPERYATENYEACLAHLKEGKPFANTNLPPGHVYRPWSLRTEAERLAAGVKSDLKENGDWGM